MLAGLCGWLAWAAWVTDIDYSDGYVTIANSRYAAGLIADYFGQRGPFLAFWLAPASWLAERWAWHPLDIRLHHLSLAVLHVAYLLAVARLLARTGRHAPAVRIAFLATIPSYIFLSYAPFISHDIFPGALFLAMLVVAAQFVRTRGWGALALLACLGYAAALTKNLYGLFWVAILLAYGWILLGRGRARGAIATWALLWLGAAASGIASWLTYAWVLGGALPDVPFPWRPYQQILGVARMYGAADLRELFAWWLYWRNFPLAYGVLTSLLIVPGLVLALRSASPFRQSVALSWLACFAAMQLIVFKEVRYLAYLAPLSAVLLVPVVRFAWSRAGHRWLRWGMLGLLALDLGKGLLPAWHLDQPFYRDAGMRRLLEPIERHPSAPVVLTQSLSLAPGDGYSPLRGDRYHRLFHVTDRIIVRLYGYPDDRVTRITDLAAIDRMATGELLYFANIPLVRLPGENIPLARRGTPHVQFVAMSGSPAQTGIAGAALRFEYDAASGAFRWTAAGEGGSGRLFTRLTPGGR